jgi:DNA polymerase-3 subunit delta
MGLSSPQKLISDIAKGRFQPVYYLFGSEDYRIAEAVKYLARSFLPDRQMITNFRRLDGRKIKSADLVAELSVFPMLGERQAFAVSDIQSYKPTEVERILKLLEMPDANRIVMFTTPSARAPKKKSAFFKKISAAAEAVEFGPLTEAQSENQIRSKLKKAGLEIEPEALRNLTGLLAGNRGALEMEVGKLIDFKNEGETVTAEDIASVGAGYEAYSIFELAEQVVTGDRAKVLAMIRRFLAEGSSATGVLFFLGQHFVSLYLVKAGKRLEPFRRWLEPKFRSQAAQYAPGQLEEIIRLIAETDADLRRRRTPPELLLDQLVVRIMAL